MPWPGRWHTRSAATAQRSEIPPEVSGSTCWAACLTRGRRCEDQQRAEGLLETQRRTCTDLHVVEKERLARKIRRYEALATLCPDPAGHWLDPTASAVQPSIRIDHTCCTETLEAKIRSCRTRRAPQAPRQAYQGADIRILIDRVSSLIGVRRQGHSEKCTP